ncbi:MAG: hypothetical protein HFI69_07410 [Lachnospiraceae bacterium]|jgi:hypothetical protein|nr:hypothetical protein [Lachnospiraceae bacterium]
MNIMLPANNIEETQRRNPGKTIDISRVIRNVTGVEQDQEKKSVLQQLLEPKEVDEGQNDAKKAAEIARRIARGAHVSPEEKKFLMETDPRLAQMAELARKEGERIKHALSQAASKEEQQTVVQQAYQMVQQVSKSNEQFGMLLGEAVKAAVQESQKKGNVPEEIQKEDKTSAQTYEIGIDESAGMHNKPFKDEQEKLLQQFFPDEWMSMLDCRS